MPDLQRKDQRGFAAVRRLMFLRHAKAEPGDPDQDDHMRALTARGLSDAAAMARYMRAQGYRPDLILCSDSRRTLQTAEAVLAEMPSPVDYLGPLYLAQPGFILSLIQSAAETDSALLVIGHNPGLEECASLLAREPVRRKEQARHDLLEEKFPTAALAVLDFTTPQWQRVGPGGGKLVDFVRPVDL